VQWAYLTLGPAAENIFSGSFLKIGETALRKTLIRLTLGCLLCRRLTLFFTLWTRRNGEPHQVRSAASCLTFTVGLLICFMLYVDLFLFTCLTQIHGRYRRRW